MQIITFAMGKGGVGKSTSAVSVAHKYALHDYKTLLVDFGPQGSCATLLGFDPAPGVVRLVDDPTPAALRSALVDTGRGFDLLPGNAEIRRLERYFMQADESVQRTAHQLRSLWSEYDAVMIDTHPGYWFQELAIYLASTLVLTCAVEFASVAELGVTLDLAQQIGAKPEQIIVLPTMYWVNRVESRENLATIEAAFPGRMAPPVPYLEAVKQCPSYGQTIWEYGPAQNSGATAAYTQLVEEWLMRDASDVLFGQ
jgi:chromosome partitioning protein